MELHYATIWESITDTVPTATAVVHGDDIKTWQQYDERAARLAAAYTAARLGHDSKIGLYMYNGNEYLEAQYGAFKVRGVPTRLRGGSVDARGDHRIAMLGAVAGLVSREGVEVGGAESVAVSFPGFFDLLESLRR